MGYLRYYDYLGAVQGDNLAQVINSDTGLRLQAELIAEEEAKSRLSQKYDIAREFADTLPFSMTATYNAEALVELNFPDYNTANNYNINDLVINSGSAYICIATTTGAFDPNAWTKLGVKYDLFYVKMPEQEFNYKNYYKKGDVVFWNNKVYTALLPTQAIDHTTALQYGVYSNIPIRNVFPDDPYNGSTYWGTGTDYSVSGVLPTDPTKWVKGDNRSALLVRKLVDIVLYELHSRIPPRNIPKIREDRHAAAIAWLDMAKEGEVSANIPLLQPKQGARIRWGSAVKNFDDDI